MAAIADTKNHARRSVRPSISADPAVKPFALEQELTPFGKWTTDSIWVPPKDVSAELASSMLDRMGPFASRDQRWAGIVEEHRSKFTQVREIELTKASIRLPQGRVFVAITERDRFDEITDPVPNCVRTRLEEFLEGPGKQRGVKVYYLKPLCIEVDDELIFTTRDQLKSAIAKIQSEVFAEYRRKYWGHRAKRFALAAVDASLAIPRALLRRGLERRKREISDYQAKLEFNRRETAFRAAEIHRKCRSQGCTFDEMLSLTNAPDDEDVIEQYAKERELSRREKQMFLMATTMTLPWFVTLALGVYHVASVLVTVGTSVAVCDPAFVAEMPGSNGVLLKIGHFDKIRGVTHVEI